ncbi:MAG: DUF4115 domain-containing protein [Gammaproteobacteria bacterium]|nr:DUF4115 domain-containing protein [Gammaproteobacteria bacterium]MDH5800925.1 DUF4115 domain-containing protein [Gammaproteobacteria bacterium]
MSDETAEAEVEETVEVYARTPAVGARLQRAREDRNIERADIARWLKLDVKTIAAIEQDDADVLPQPVYTVGYLRAYAKLVELSPDSVASDYLQSHETSGAEVPIYRQATVHSRLQKVTESLPKGFTLFAHSNLALLKRYGAITGALAVLVTMSWFSLYYSDDVPVPELQTRLDDAVEKNIQSTNLEVLSNDVAPIDADTLSRLQGSEEKPQQVTKPLTLEKRERTDTGFIAPLETTEDLKTNLSLKFSANSWVQIMDATGKPLMKSLGLAGATKELSGVAPFDVILGNGPAVEIKYNGEVYDFSKYQGKEDVARFTLKAP